MTCNRAARDAFTGMAPLFMSWRRAEQTGEGEWSYRDASGHKERGRLPAVNARIRCISSVSTGTSCHCP